ncbi:MAG: hypothetical protein ABL962_04045 [Fimbriimonadaceae bacterium]
MTDETTPETDLEKQLEEIEQGIKAPALPDFHQDYEGQLADIESRAKARKNLSKEKHDFAFREERGKKRYVDTGKGLVTGVSIAYAIMGCPIAGFAVGWVVNREKGGPIGLMVGVVFAVIFVVIMLGRDKK